MAEIGQLSNPSLPDGNLQVHDSFIMVDTG
jgi:hypothetical protein